MPSFPPIEIGTKLAVSLAVGLLIGFEREWAHKDLGVRTFAITSLLGMLAALVGTPLIISGFFGVAVLVTLVNAGNLIQRRPLETTTGAAMLATYALGVLAGQGHVFTPAAAAIVTTLLLALKPQLSRFAGGLLPEEVRGAVLLGLIGFVIYPILPNRFIDPWQLINPREIWLTIILIASIGFVNYVLLRVYGGKSLYYTAVFGGFVNSTAAIAELSRSLAALGPGGANLTIIVNLLTIVAMFIRNLALLAIFSPPAAILAGAPIAAMAVSTFVFIWWLRPRTIVLPDLELGSPISLRQIAQFGAILVVIQVIGSVGQRVLGQAGAVVVAALGGLVSSASSTAAVANLSAHGELTPSTAALAGIIASATSAMVNLPILYRRSSDKGTIGRLLAISLVVIGAGVITFVAIHIFRK
jgi:uncharacterized membrane protein (DUF4010 family)